MVRIRRFKKTELDKYAADKEFFYDEKKELPGASWWDRFWRWLWRLWSSVAPKSGGGEIFKWVLVTASVAFIAFAVLKFMEMDVLRLFTGKSRQVDLPYEESIENIHEISFDQEIDKAVDQHNYRLAVRLLYLRALKHLSDTGRIAWKHEKTNAEYIAELSSGEKKERFRSLTRQFEYVWYGDFPVNEGAFRRMQNGFNEFNRMHV